MAEMADAGEDHRQPMFVRGGDDFGIAHRTARLDHRSNTGLGSCIDTVAKWEEGIRRHR